MRKITPLDVLFSGSNLLAGAYKGYMNAVGHEVDPTYLLYVGGGTSALKGISDGAYCQMYNSTTEKERLEGWRTVFREELSEDKIDPELLERTVKEFKAEEDKRYLGKSALREGTKTFARALPIAVLEIAVGYGIGYVLGKLSH